MRELTRLPSRPLAATMLALAALVAAPEPVLAQADDEALVHHVRVTIANALNQALERARSDRPVAWSDPSGVLAGVVTVYSPIMRDGRPCRSFKYVVHDASREVTDTGLYCRDPIGLWSSAGIPDIVATRLTGPAPAPPGPETAGPVPDGIKADPMVARLQGNLVRLAYDAGPADGLRQPRFETALQQFEQDEELPQGNDPGDIRRALTQSAAAVARSGRGGFCEAPAGSEDTALACGRRR